MPPSVSTSILRALVTKVHSDIIKDSGADKNPDSRKAAAAGGIAVLVILGAVIAEIEGAEIGAVLVDCGFPPEVAKKLAASPSIGTETVGAALAAASLRDDPTVVPLNLTAFTNLLRGVGLAVSKGPPLTIGASLPPNVRELLPKVMERATLAFSAMVCEHLHNVSGKPREEIMSAAGLPKDEMKTFIEGLPEAYTEAMIAGAMLTAGHSYTPDPKVHH